jgi:hypothetical protein
VAVEAGYGWHVDSLALLADAVHNLGDVAGLVLAWGGALAGRLRPDARHTYGWKRASLLAAFVNALLLLVAMGALAWEALHRLSAPAPVEGLTIVAVAALGIVINTATALLFLRGRDEDLNIRGAYLHMVGDALVSLGVVIAGALTWRFGWAWLDPVVSLVIAAKPERRRSSPRSGWVRRAPASVELQGVITSRLLFERSTQLRGGKTPKMAMQAWTGVALESAVGAAPTLIIGRPKVVSPSPP